MKFLFSRTYWLIKLIIGYLVLVVDATFIKLNHGNAEHKMVASFVILALIFIVYFKNEIADFLINARKTK